MIDSFPTKIQSQKENSAETNTFKIEVLTNDEEIGEPIHGHNWKVEADVEGETLDDVGLWNRRTRMRCIMKDNGITSLYDYQNIVHY